MTLLGIKLGTQREDEAAEELGRPDMAEAKDLALHVERCAKRWSLVYRGQNALKSDMLQMKLAMAGIVMLILLYSGPGGNSIVKWVMAG